MIRTELERRPLLVLSLGLILGLTLLRHPIHSFLLLPAPWILKELTPRAALIGGLVLAAVLAPPGPPKPMFQNQFVDSSWIVASLPKLTPYGQRCEIEQSPIRLQLSYAGPVELCPGATIHVVGLAKPPVEGTEAFFASRELVGRLDARRVQIEEEAPWIQRLGFAWRRSFIDFASRNLPPDAATTVGALCFNVDGLIDSSTRDKLQRTGTTHIIAASGLQMVVIAQALLWLLSWLPIPRSIQLCAVGFVLILYAVATGLHASILRAVTMWLVANSAYLARREPDWPSALAASSILYLIWKPAGVYEMGFQFSMLAVLFLSLFTDGSKWKPGLEARLYRTARRALRGAILAFVVLTPLIAYYFGIVSLVAVPANLLVVVAVAPVVIVSMVALPLSWLLPAVAGALMRAIIPLTSYIDYVLNAYGGERAAVQVPPFSAYWLVPYYILLLLVWRPLVRRP